MTIIILFNVKLGIFSQNYAVILSFISCFSFFYCLNPYKIDNFLATSLFSPGGHSTQDSISATVLLG